MQRVLHIQMSLKVFLLRRMRKGKFQDRYFEENGFDIEIIGIEEYIKLLLRWRTKLIMKSGVLGLRDTRKGNSGRPTQKELSLEEKYERLEAKIQLLKAENELLKKLDMMERGWRKTK